MMLGPPSRPFRGAGESMNITLNGEPREVRDRLTVAELVAELELRPQQVAVELNRKLVARARRDEAELSEGDEVELVTLVGGG
jgi:thiamine biosynthesis protein ThiS